MTYLDPLIQDLDFDYICDYPEESQKIQVFYSCNCGYIGCIDSDTTKCPRCKFKLDFIHGKCNGKFKILESKKQEIEEYYYEDEDYSFTGPIIEELEAPHDSKLHDVFDLVIEPIIVLYTCGCGFFGYIESISEVCPKCSIKLKFYNGKLIPE